MIRRNALTYTSILPTQGEPGTIGKDGANYLIYQPLLIDVTKKPVLAVTLLSVGIEQGLNRLSPSFGYFVDGHKAVHNSAVV